MVGRAMVLCLLAACPPPSDSAIVSSSDCGMDGLHYVLLDTDNSQDCANAICSATERAVVITDTDLCEGRARGRRKCLQMRETFSDSNGAT